MIVCEWFLYFIIYAFLGYICEVIYVALCTKKITNRGFLYGPLVPIYGFGALIILIALNWAYDYWYLVFILGWLLTTTLEYIVSYAMELLFHMRWWDYSDKILNINGRVCLRNSAMFAGLVMIVIYGIHPFISKGVINVIDIKALGILLTALIFIGFTVDSVFSTMKHVKIATIIKKLNSLQKALKDKEAVASEAIAKKKEELQEYIVKTRAYEKLDQLMKKYPSFRIKSKKFETRGSAQDFKEGIKKDEQ